MNKTNNKKIATIILLVFATASIIFGIYRGDIKDVYNKASRICYECIGIG